MPKNKLINLLPQEEFEASLLGRALRWAMGTFRIIVIVTEMLVMGAFLSRFWLDAQNADLDNSIKISSAQISAQSSFEKEFRALQKKLNIFKSVSASNIESSKVDSIASKIPMDVVLSSINDSGNSLLAKGFSGSEIGVAQFMSNLKSDKTVKSVSLESIGSSDQNQALITFLIKISY